MGLKWIKTVKIKNFLTHKDTEINLDKGINVFVGDSNAGKSACIKALRWLFYNEPRGDGFIRYDQERLDIETKQKKNKGEYKCSVSVEMSDETIIERSQSLSASSNKYIIYKPGEEPLVLTGFGRDVPEEISNAIGFSALALGSRGKFEINYMPQLGEPAALAFQGEELSRTLNFAHSLDQFEEVLSRISTKLHPSSAIAGGIRTFEERLKIKKSDLEKLPDRTLILEKAKDAKKYILDLINLENIIQIENNYIKEFNEIEENKNKIIKDIDKNDKILSITDLEIDINYGINQCTIAINMIREYVYNNDKIENINQNSIENRIVDEIDYRLIEEYSLSITQCMSIIGEINSINNSYIDIDNKLININKIIDIDIMDSIDEILSNINNSYNLICDFMSMEKRVVSINKEDSEINSTIDKYISNLNDVASKFIEILSSEGLCPTCFSNIDSKSAKDIVDKYISIK